MRISKVTGISHLKKTEFGYLAKDRESTKTNVISDIEKDIEKKLCSLNFEKSMQDKIVKKNFKYNEKVFKTNEITNFVKYLCFGELQLNKDKTCPYKNMIDQLKNLYYQNNIMSEESKELIKFSLTHYGYKLKDNDNMTIENMTIENLIITMLNNNINDKKSLDVICAKMKDTIKEEIKKKRDNIAKSLLNNKVQFKIENKQLVPQSERSKWLISFIENNSLNNTLFEKLATLYNFGALENLFTKQSEIRNNSYIKTLLQKHYIENWGKIKEGLSSEEKKAFSFYSNEVNIYFSHYFPFVGKRKNAQHAKNSFKNDNEQTQVFTNAKKYYLKSDTIKNTVKKQIVNQLTNAIITQGKLIDYYYDFPTNEWKKTCFTSETFEEIRINEAFKKQVLQTVSFAFNRLRYFMCDTINEDISGKFEKYFTSINEDLSFLRTKYFFNYKEDDSFNREILKEIHTGVNSIRLNTYHFKSGNGLEILKHENDYPLASNFLKNDLTLVKEQFVKRFITMNIPIYYDFEAIEKLLTKCKFGFENLATNLRPSFNKVFEKGYGLFNADDNNIYLCDWFHKFDGDKDKQSVYKNVLQLLYMNVFIPSITHTDFDKKYFKIAYENNKKIAQKNIGKEKVFEYKYEEIEKALAKILPVENVSSLLNKIQGFLMREQSLLEDEEFQDEKIKKNPSLTNKFVEYIQDVFVLAFNGYLEQNFSDLKKVFFNPQKRIDTKISYEEKEKIKNLITINTSSFDNFKYPNFYLLIRILSKSELNELKNQFIKYVTYLKSLPDYNRIKIQSMLNTQVNELNTQVNEFNKIIELMDIVNLTEPKNASNNFDYPETDINKTTKDILIEEQNALNKAFEENYCEFIEGGYDHIHEYIDLYAQPLPVHPNEQYKATLIPQRGLTGVSRLGTLQYYKNVLAKPSCYFVTKDEYLTYKNDTNLIDELHEIRANTHKELIDWHKAKHSNKNTSKKPIDTKEIAKINDVITIYKDTIGKISKYDQLKNKLTFSDLNRINNIHMSILSRLIGFSNDWEKDMLFILKYFQYNNYFKIGLNEIYFQKQSKILSFKQILKTNQHKNIKNIFLEFFDDNQYKNLINDIFLRGNDKSAHADNIDSLKNLLEDRAKNSYIDELFEKGECVGKIIDILSTAEHSDFTKNLLLPLLQITDLKKLNVRNEISHLAQLFNPGVSIIDLINKLRYILTYDRKKKNAVTKAIIDLLAKENIILILEKKNDAFEIKNIKSEQIIHLKMFQDIKGLNKKVFVNYYSEAFVHLIKEVMESKIN